MKNNFQRLAERYLDDNHAEIPAAVRDTIAEKVTNLLLIEFEKDGQRHRWPASDELGNPRCSWCGGMGFNSGSGATRTGSAVLDAMLCTCTEPRVGAE